MQLHAPEQPALIHLKGHRLQCLRSIFWKAIFLLAYCVNDPTTTGKWAVFQVSPLQIAVNGHTYLIPTWNLAWWAVWVDLSLHSCKYLRAQPSTSLQLNVVLRHTWAKCTFQLVFCLNFTPLKKYWPPCHLLFVQCLPLQCCSLIEGLLDTHSIHIRQEQVINWVMETSLVGCLWR